ncbi:MAG: ParA family protein, partial [Solirubrobacterales bacterium]|nr:ParA family protein [Solirubrobacterales bacterium]
ILDYRPDLAVDYMNVADEVLRRLGLDEPRRRLSALAGSPAGARA